MYCPKCGCENNDGANFCTSCGYNYSTGANENASKVKRNGKLTEKKKKTSGCLTALIIVIIIFGVFLVALLSGDDSGSDVENSTNNNQVDNVQNEENSPVLIYEDDIVKASFVKVFDIEEVSSTVEGVSYMQLYIENKSEVAFTVSFKNAAINGMSTTIGSGLPVTILPGNASQQPFILFTGNTNVESAEDIEKIQFQFSLFDENVEIVDETSVITIDVK